MYQEARSPKISKKIRKRLSELSLAKDETPQLLVVYLEAYLLTDKRLLKVGHNSDRDQSWDRSTFGIHFERRWLGDRWVLHHKGETEKLGRLQPKAEGMRLWSLCPAIDSSPPSKSETLSDSDSTDPGALPVAVFDDIAAYSDRIIDDEGNHFPLRGQVQARVEELGNITAVRGRNLADKFFYGPMVFGPLGPFISGNAKVSKEDNRELYLMVQGDGWVFSRKCDLKHSRKALEFAARIESLTATRPEPPTTQAPSIAQELRDLAQLRDEGILTSDEFEQQKTRLLDS